MCIIPLKEFHLSSTNILMGMEDVCNLELMKMDQWAEIWMNGNISGWRREYTWDGFEKCVNLDKGGNMDGCRWRQSICRERRNAALCPHDCAVWPLLFMGKTIWYSFQLTDGSNGHILPLPACRKLTCWYSIGNIPHCALKVWILKMVLFFWTLCSLLHQLARVFLPTCIL